MADTFGKALTATLFGESHGPYIGITLDGLSPGIRIDTHYISSQLTLRRPQGKESTARVEADEFQIISGVFEGYTTGSALTILIPNTNTKSGDYSVLRETARPGHADYTAQMRYKGFQDYRGGGHFSGRVTSALVAAGAVVLQALKSKGINIASHILECENIKDEHFSEDGNELAKQMEKMNFKSFAVLSDDVEIRMRDAVLKASMDCDSVGGVLETVITGLEPGLGEPWFDSFESLLSHAVFSIPAVKGIQFGSAFEKTSLRGSSYNDPLAVRDGKVVTLTNNNAGINGGITNGMPVVFQCAVKPTPSIFKTQKTVNFISMEDTQLSLTGRHDPSVIHRARVVVDSVCALVVYDLLSRRYGNLYFKEER